MTAQQTVIISASGTWDVPQHGVVSDTIVVRAWGPGGTGADGDGTDGGGGGGGGAFSMASVTGAVAGKRYTITATSGSDTDFSGLVIAKKGASASGATHGAGGLASGGTGTTKFNGGDGQDGENLGAGGAGGAVGTETAHGAAGGGGASGPAGTIGGTGASPGDGGGGGGFDASTPGEGAPGGGAQVSITFTPNEAIPTGHWGGGASAGATRGKSPGALFTHVRGGPMRAGRGLR